MICPCPLPDGERFFCEPHQVTKTSHLRNLCLTDPRYRRAWDEGKGPGQLVATSSPKELPPLGEQVIGFLTSMAAFFGDGCKLTDTEEFNRRVEICSGCRFFIHESGRCSECGCCGKLKALGKVWKCPKGKW